MNKALGIGGRSGKKKKKKFPFSFLVFRSLFFVLNIASKQKFFRRARYYVPVFMWLPKYNFKEDFPIDLTAGKSSSHKLFFSLLKNTFHSKKKKKNK
jgi:hypothetical protein